MDEKWQKRFLGLAKREISNWSRDPSTKVSCIIVDEDKNIVSTGFNGFPKGIHDCSEKLQDRDYKKQIIIHAEENALLRARQGVSGCTAITNVPPCSKCTSLMVNAGTSKIITIKPTEDILTRYKNSFEISKDMMTEAGIEYIEYDDEDI